MRRVLESLKWKAQWWDNKADARSDVGLTLREGIMAYALEQAKLQRDLAASFEHLWKTPLHDIKKVLQTLDIPESNLNNPDENADDDDDNNSDEDEIPDDDYEDI